MKDRLHEILAMREAHDAYRELLARVVDLTRRHPRGLQIKLMFGQQPRRAARRLRKVAWIEGWTAEEHAEQERAWKALAAQHEQRKGA